MDATYLVVVNMSPRQYEQAPLEEVFRGEIDERCTVSQVKAHFAPRLQIQPDQIVLKFQGQRVWNTETLESLGVDLRERLITFRAWVRGHEVVNAILALQRNLSRESE